MGMRATRHRTLLSLAVATAVGSLAIPASAQPAPTPAPADFSAQLYEPTPAGDRFFRVSDGRVRGILDGYSKLDASYAYRPLGELEPGRDYITSQLYTYVDLTLSLAHLLQINLDVPVALVQSGDDGFTPEPSSAFGDLRLGLRVGAWQSSGGELALGLQGDFWFPTGQEDVLAGDGAVRANPQLVLGGAVDWFVYAANAGYLLREREQLGSAEVGGALTYGVALGAQLWQETLQLSAELSGQAVVPGEDSRLSFFDGALTPLELLFGLKGRLGPVVLGAAAGPGLGPAPGVPDVRVVLSLGFIEDHRVFDRDGDRLDDCRDACPDEPGFGDDGCPLPDRDGDSVLDDQDACPDDAGLVHLDPRQHGCPAP